MSKIEVNTVEPQCGTTLTLGASGDTVALGSGASQTGFGQTYSAVEWDTTAKTTTVTGVAGVGYFINTSGAAVTANLPAGVAGNVIAFADYTRTFQTNNLTIAPNGSEKIGGVAATLVAVTEGQSITLVYVDATEGWINTTESTGQAGALVAFVTATGGTPTTSGDYKIHTFTGPGTFCVSCAGNPLGSTEVDYMIIAGGGGGGASHGAGGGAGGYRESPGTVSGSYTVSPLGVAPAVALPVSVTGYPITVGGGGAITPSGTGGGNPGSPSIFSTITSSSGGGAGGEGPTNPAARTGGSGGGEYETSGVGSGNTPPTTPPQGKNGGTASHGSPNYGQGGGGGSGAVGGNGTPTVGGNGGAGVTSSINAAPTARAGGGGGATYQGGTGGTGGSGGGGNGTRGGPGGTNGTAGTVNTGGGGGGGERCVPNTNGWAGGSGIVIIRYKFQ